MRRKKKKKIAARRSWGGLKPTSRIVEDQTKYRRERARKEARRQLEQESD